MSSKATEDALSVGEELCWAALIAVLGIAVGRAVIASTLVPRFGSPLGSWAARSAAVLFQP
jgi:hypothetical protein